MPPTASTILEQQPPLPGFALLGVDGVKIEHMATYPQAASAAGNGEDGGASSPEASGNVKRKRQDSGGAQHRAKRNRYISIACNECKRRKIKCNGETPCQRCGNLDLDCIYSPNCCSNSFKDSPEYKQLTAQVATLQEQVQEMMYSINAIRTSASQEENNKHYPNHEELMQDQAVLRRRASPQQSRFHGATSSNFGLGVAHSSLRNMGIANAEEVLPQSILGNDEEPTDTNTTANPYISNIGSPGTTKRLHSSKDPIWALTKDEAMRLCQVYEDETHTMYPVVDMVSLTRHAGMLFQFIDAVSKTIMVSSMPGADDMQDQDTDLLKLIFAVTLVIEGNGQSSLAKSLFDNVNRNTDSRLLGSVNLRDIQTLALSALYHFHSDDEGLAWRVIGLTARLCIELGLHRSATYNTMFQTEKERVTALNLFWSVYVLDHRWSFGTGMSFALHDSDIDRQLPRPTDTTPYLKAMVDYCNISSRCWQYITAADTSNQTFSKDDILSLDYHIMQWYAELPENMKLIHPNNIDYSKYSESDPNLAESRSNYRHRLMLHLRANQMRIAIYRTVLYSSSSIQSSLSSLNFAETAVEVAKDTIRILTYMNNRSDIYKTRQVTWNHFLLSALAALFLAVCHAPAQFAESSRDEFYMALELVRGLSSSSYVSKRLWRAIRGLKRLGPKVGLFARRSEKKASPMVRHGNNHNSRDEGENEYSARNTPTQFANDFQPTIQNDQRSAAMAMAGLAGHPVDESAFYGNNAATNFGSPTTIDSNITTDQITGQTLMSPQGMVNELTTLFEAAGAYANIPGMSLGNFASGDTPQGGLSQSTLDSSNAMPAGSNPSPGDLTISTGTVPEGSVEYRTWAPNDDGLNKLLRELF